MIILDKCAKCKSEAKMIYPKRYNLYDGWRVVCVMKKCKNNQAGNYLKECIARGQWNKAQRLILRKMRKRK